MAYSEKGWAILVEEPKKPPFPHLANPNAQRHLWGGFRVIEVFRSEQEAYHQMHELMRAYPYIKCTVLPATVEVIDDGV